MLDASLKSRKSELDTTPQHAPSKAKVRPIVGRPHQADKPPLTPPRVSGKCLAPALDASTSDRAAAGAPERPKPQGRPSLTHINLPGKALGPAAAAATTASGGGASSVGVLPLIAEGRGIGQRGLTIETTVPELDPRIAAYHDINGDLDSICSTPPALSMNWLTRGEDHGALGPLTPHPLSPSILTLCGRPGLDDQFAFADPLGPKGLVDMRECESPRLPA